MSNNFFTICSLFYSFMLTIIYFKRKTIKTMETKVYSKLVLINFINVVFAILCAFTILLKEQIPFITDFIGKTLLLMFFLWELYFTVYLIVITDNNDNLIQKRLEKNKILLSTFGLALVFLIYSLPLYYHNENKIIYSYGPSANLVYALTALFMLYWIITIIRNYKILKTKKCIPVILFILLAIVAVIIQKINPGLLLITSVETFITVIMFFTIENPDMKLLEEVHKSKEISDSANDEKMMFLYNISQEIRNSTDIVDDYANLILESNDNDEIKDSARNIKMETTRFNALMNEMFDVTKIDASNIKVYNSKYNVKNVLKEIVSIYGNKCNKKALEFRVNIDHNVPEMLYGDSINLKKVLMIILDNSLEYTKEGYVEFNVNTIIKGDVCRLIISIEDSGSGIKGEDIGDLKVNNKSFSEANKLITLMSGAINISSNYGYGTKVKIILDQKIELIENEDVVKYEKLYDNVKLLMVDDSEAGIKIIDKIIKGTNIKMDFAMNGKDCLEKIKTGNYDLILLDEQLTQISATELIKKINSIKNFDTPVILLTKDNSFEYNDEYKNTGFNDYILKPVKKKDLLDKMDSCVKKDK